LCLADFRGGEEEYECFVVEEISPHSLVALPAPLLDELASWTSGRSGAGEQSTPGPKLVVGDGTYPLLKVTSSALTARRASAGTLVSFASRPASRAFLQAFYSSTEAIEAADFQTATDIEAPPPNLREENEVLKREIARLTGAAARGQRSGGRKNGGPAARPQRFASPADDEDNSGEDDDEGEAGDEPPLDALGRLMQNFSYDGARGASGAQSSGRPATSLGRAAASVAPQGAGGSPVGPSPGGELTALQLQIQFEMLKSLKEMQRGALVRDDAPDGDSLDGLRVARNLSRMRQLREQLQKNPERVSQEYRRGWVEELGAEGRSFRWIDTNKAIRWRKYASMKRVHWMMCHVLESMEKKDHAVAQALLVQCMKSVHEFSNHGSWKTAWPLCFLPDPLATYHHGGTEVEMETVLGFVRVQDDLKKKTAGGSRETMEESDGDDAADGATHDKSGGKGRRKKPAGKKAQEEA